MLRKKEIPHEKNIRHSLENVDTSGLLLCIYTICGHKFTKPKHTAKLGWDNKHTHTCMYTHTHKMYADHKSTYRFKYDHPFQREKEKEKNLNLSLKTFWGKNAVCTLYSQNDTYESECCSAACVLQEAEPHWGAGNDTFCWHYALFCLWGTSVP